MKKTVKSNLALSFAILIIGITALMVMAWLSPAPSDRPAGNQGISAAQQLAPPTADHGQGSKPMATDPFAEKLGATAGIDASKSSGIPLVTRENTIPLGVDPFKAKLEEQSRQAISSPFGQPLTKP
jgi:hypothetical protein